MSNCSIPLLGERYSSNGASILELNAVQKRALACHKERLKTKLYRTETVSCCPVCRSEDSELLAAKDRYGLPLSTVACKSCGLIRSNPRMTQNSFAEFYNGEYRQLYVGKSEASEEFFNDQYNRGTNILDYVQSNISRPVRDMFVFEVGAGAGGILKVFRDAGAEVAGCDFGEEYLEFGRERHGINLFRGSLEECELIRKPDLIIYSHVFEHILEPKQELVCIKNKLADNGAVYIEVPGVKNIQKSYESDFLRYLQNAHVFHYTRQSLKNIFSTEGFELLNGDEFVHALFTAGTSNENADSFSKSDYEDIIRFLLLAERARPKIQARLIRRRKLKRIRQAIRAALRTSD